MTNAIETTKREMYEHLEIIKQVSKKPLLCGYLENALESHLEQLRQQYEQMAATARDRFESLQSAEERSQQLSGQLEDMRNLTERLRGYALRDQSQLAEMKRERDAIRNKLQALQMASQTSAEVIRGLHSELLEARECNAIALNEEEPESPNSDPYRLGFNSEGKGQNPFPLNTIERSRWYRGASDAITAKNHSYEGFCTSSGEMFFGDKS